MSLSFTFLRSIRSTYSVTCNIPLLGCSKGPLQLSLSVRSLLSWPLPPYQNGTTSSCSVTWSPLMSPLRSFSASLGEVLLGSSPRHFWGLLFLFHPDTIILGLDYFTSLLVQSHITHSGSGSYVPRGRQCRFLTLTHNWIPAPGEESWISWIRTWKQSGRRREAGISSFKSCTSLWSPKGKGEGRGINYKVRINRYTLLYLGFPGGSASKECTFSEEDSSLTPGSGRSSGEGHGYPL